MFPDTPDYQLTKNDSLSSPKISTDLSNQWIFKQRGGSLSSHRGVLGSAMLGDRGFAPNLQQNLHFAKKYWLFEKVQ